MSPVSKIVFKDKAKADAFAASCGGMVVYYTNALLTAKVSVEKENKSIDGRKPGICNGKWCECRHLQPREYREGRSWMEISRKLAAEIIKI